jgi:hypothetical protein
VEDFLEISKAMSFLNKLMLSQGANGNEREKTPSFIFRKKACPYQYQGKT